MNAKRLIAGLMPLLPFAVFGGTYEFVSKGAEIHYFDNPGEWQLYDPRTYNVLPQAGHNVQVDALASTSLHGKVYLTNDVSAAFTQVKFLGGCRTTGLSGSMRFIGTNAVFTLPAVSDDGTQYNVWPMYFNAYYNGQTYNLVGLTNGVDRYAAKACLDKADFTVGCNADGSLYARFGKGSYDFGKPQGAESSSRLMFGVSDSADMDISFEEGTSLRMYSATLRSSRAILNMKGASVETLLDFRANGGALNVDGGTFFAGNLSVNAGKVAFTNGASVTVSGEFAVKGRSGFLLQDASLKVGGRVTVSGTTPLFDFRGGSFSTEGKMVVGDSSGYGKLSVSGGEFTLLDGDGIELGVSAGSSGEIEISGGTVHVSRIRMARYVKDGVADGETVFRQTGGKVRLHHSGFGGILILQGGNVHSGSQTVELNGGVSEFRFLRSEAAGKGRLFADGGTLVPTESSENFISGLNVAQVGEKGLTLDTSGYDVTVDQSFSDKDGVSGSVRKTGVGTVTYKGGYSVSRTVVDGGALRIDGEDTVFATELLITNGATFSMAGTAVKAGLSSLAVTNATITLDPGDVIEVSGDVSCSRLRLNWTALPDVAVPFIVADGEMSEATRREISSALFANVLQEGTHASFEFSFDASTGKTTVSAKVAADVPIPESDTVAWTGSGRWGVPANWEGDAVPSVSQRALFESATAGKEVEVDAGTAVGAIRFAGDGYLLNGEGPLEFAGEVGSVRIDVESGSHEVAVPLELPAALAVSAAAGASLELSGGISRGGIVKSGTGRLVLSAPSAVDGSVTSSDGMVTVKDEDALGDSGDTSVMLGGGTVEFRSSDGSAMRIRPDISVSAPETNDLVVFKTDTDVTVDSFSVTKGAFAKRGTGRLTVEIGYDSIPVLAKDVGNTGDIAASYSDGGLVFPEDGTVPVCESKYPGFGIAEGEVLLKAVAPGARAEMPGLAVVGVPAAECAVQPSLTVDGVDLDCSGGGQRFYVGNNLGKAGVKSAALRILNGGSVYISGSQIGYASTSADARVFIAATNGTFRIKGDISTYISRMHGTDGAKAVYRFKDSSLLVDSAKLWIGGGIDLEFVNSVWSAPEGGVTVFTGESARPNGVMFFRDGSVFASLALSENESMNRDLVFAFDDAEWLYSRTRSTCTIPASTTGHSIYEMRGRGVILAPAEGAVYTVNAKLEGEGGMVKRGEGTVKFGSGAYAFSGVCDIESGVVDLSGAGEVSVKVKGPGTVAGADFSSLTVVAEVDGAGVVGDIVTLDGCTLPSRVTVDLGRNAENPLPQLYSGLQIARFTGAAPDVSGWKVTGSGSGTGTGPIGYRVGGKFRVSGDTVLVDLVAEGGFSVMIR